MMVGALRRGDIVAIESQSDHGASTVSLRETLASRVLGLVEALGTHSARADVWTPFALWTGTGQFNIARDQLTRIGHIRILDATTTIVRAEQEHRLTTPVLAALDKPTRLRVAFLQWCFDFGPCAGFDADMELILFLAEL